MKVELRGESAVRKIKDICVALVLICESECYDYGFKHEVDDANEISGLLSTILEGKSDPPAELKK